MSLPTTFKAVDHLKSVLVKVQNKIVREAFISANYQELAEGLDTPKNSLYTACKLTPNDSLEVYLLRIFFFYFVLRKARDLTQPVYGIPTQDYDEDATYKPQLLLYFQESYKDVEPGYSPIHGRISFRLVDQKYQNLSKGELVSLGRKIKSIFYSPTPYRWKKGKDCLSYRDKKKGYELIILCRNEQVGRELVSKTLQILGDSPDWSKASFKQNLNDSKAFPTNPGKQQIFGKSRRLPRKRPIADVYFCYSILRVYGLPNPIPLFDKTRVFRNALVTPET